MKLYAQHGASDGKKTIQGLGKGYIDGVIFSPRDISSKKLRTQLDLIEESHPSADRFFDPQYYAGHNVSCDNPRFGRLESCEEYGKFFQQRRRRELEQGTSIIKEDIKSCLHFQSETKLTGLIGPNILISRSFDSIEAAIAKNFIRQTGPSAAELRTRIPVYATLAVSREALLDKKELLDFLTDITVLETPPHGFYVLIASRNFDARTDIYNADVIAGWMLINYTLHLNGFAVINGYSDVLLPFLGIAGATAGATGWWSNLRTFSLDRFMPAGGGRLPVQRYLSKTLLNRITFFELDQLRNAYPDVLNGLETDALYRPDMGSEPERAEEIYQTWESIQSLIRDLSAKDSKDGMKKCNQAIEAAITAYDNIESMIRLDPKSNRNHLQAISEGIRLFANLAEIGGATLDSR